MSSRVLEKVERVADVMAKFQDTLDKLPRLVEMFGIAFFAGKASQRVGGPFETGALGGAVASGLAHSNLPHNQIGGLALGTYLAAIGLLNVIPHGVPVLPDIAADPATAIENFQASLEPNERLMSAPDCIAQGGEIVRHLPSPVESLPFGSIVTLPFLGLANPVVCRFPQPPPHEGGLDRPTRPRRITR